MQKIICPRNQAIQVPNTVEGDDRFSTEPTLEGMYEFTPNPDEFGTYVFSDFYIVVADYAYTNNNKQFARSLHTGKPIWLGHPDWPADDADVYFAPYHSSFETFDNAVVKFKEWGTRMIHSGVESSALGAQYHYTSAPDDIENMMGSASVAQSKQRLENERAAEAGEEPSEITVLYFCYDVDNVKNAVPHTAKQIEQVALDFYEHKMHYITEVNVKVFKATAILNNATLSEEEKINQINAI